MTARRALSEQLRMAIRDSDLSRYEISRRTGIAQSILSRFVNSGAGLSLANIDRLAEVLALRLTTDRTLQKRKGK